MILVLAIFIYTGSYLRVTQQHSHRGNLRVNEANPLQNSRVIYQESLLRNHRVNLSRSLVDNRLLAKP
jgi:hypothetical protein